MTQPEIQLDSEMLRAHARNVDEAAAMCGEATGGARYIDLHDEVYGVWTGPLFLPLLNAVQDWAVRELHEGTDATSHLADLLRAVADDADRSDTHAARLLRDSAK